MRLRRILAALADLGRDLAVVLPLHPRTRHALAADPVAAQSLAGLMVVDPVGYMDMLVLERGARLILTDSGGVQKEAFFHGVPCVTLRTETEWTELVDCGWNVLAPPTGTVDIAAVARAAIASDATRGARPALYGRGDASEAIADHFAKLVR